MSMPSPARYRTPNWSSYTASFRKRGSLLIWLGEDMTSLAPHDGSPGRPAVPSNATIRFRLTIGVLFHLPLRQITGRAASLLKMPVRTGRCRIARRRAGGRIPGPSRSPIRSRIAPMNRFPARGTAEIIRPA